MSQALKRQFVSKHDSRELIAEVERSAGINLDVPRSAQVEIIEPDEESKFVVIDGRFTFVRRRRRRDAPPLRGVGRGASACFPSVSIDEGAVKYILKGADVMRPGISKYDEWGEAGRLVVVREDKKGRAAAVGRTAGRELRDGRAEERELRQEPAPCGRQVLERVQEDLIAVTAIDRIYV